MGFWPPNFSVHYTSTAHTVCDGSHGVYGSTQRHKAHLRKTDVFFHLFQRYFKCGYMDVCAMCNKHTLVALRIMEAVCSLTDYGFLIIFMPWEELLHSFCSTILFHSLVFFHSRLLPILLNVKKSQPHLEIQVKYMWILWILIR